MKISPFAFAWTALLPLLATAADPKCSFLSADEGPPFSFELPSIVLSHSLSKLPIEFRGVTPIVTRSQLKHGELPKVTIERYSSRPDVFYDEVENKVIVTSSSCGEEDNESSLSDNEGSTPGAPASTSGAPASFMAPRFLTWGTTALFAGMARKPLMAGAIVAAGLATAVQAHSEACQPVVQVLVQAPAAYKGAVDVCLEEINDPAICPDPFPTYPTCNDPAPTCEVAVVGAGAGGLYSALR